MNRLPWAWVAPTLVQCLNSSVYWRVSRKQPQPVSGAGSPKLQTSSSGWDKCGSRIQSHAMRRCCGLPHVFVFFWLPAFQRNCVAIGEKFWPTCPPMFQWHSSWQPLFPILFTNYNKGLEDWPLSPRSYSVYRGLGRNSVSSVSCVELYGRTGKLTWPTVHLGWWSISHQGKLCG